jgi:hypothetical protein
MVRHAAVLHGDIVFELIADEENFKRSQVSAGTGKQKLNSTVLHRLGKLHTYK